MPSTIQANTACDSPVGQGSLADTCAEIIRDRIPNLLRLYLNPYVAQTCYCLSKYVETCWPSGQPNNHQVFLANSLEESLSGAIKLARYSAHADGRPTEGLIVDLDNRLEHFAATELTNQSAVEYLPGVRVITDADSAADLLAKQSQQFGFVVVFHQQLNDSDGRLARQLSDCLVGTARPLLIVCTSQSQLSEAKLAAPDDKSSFVPDIVVFDESLVNREVPYAAFAATRQLYAHWNRRGMATFHSTTYQPNTISSMHFLRCLETADPQFYREQEPVLRRIERDAKFRLQLFRDLYSRSLAKLIGAVGFDQDRLHVEGHYVLDGDRRIFDGVAGVACSIRGHNPSSFVEQIEQTGELASCREELHERLHALTGLPYATPAVSGASAVEQALKIGLCCQSPRNHVLALQGGFGGKTLFALTGTWKPALKAGLPDLYPHVVYVDPFAADACEQIAAMFDRHPIGVVQCELVQGVGGVRAIPPAVLKQLQIMRQQYDCLLLVDEVQTGVYRTGPFVRSTELGIEPDLLTIGKSMSDMMFPFAMTLHNERVQGRLDQLDCQLPECYGERHGYEYGYRTVLNTLRRAEAEHLDEQVLRQGCRLAEMLTERLQLCPHVREVRGYGLLVGIELNTKFFLLPWLKKIILRLYLLAMIRRREFPVMVGFCQYEPHVFKFTPPLSTTDEELQQICETIGKVIGMSPLRLCARLARELLRS